ncbi:MAG: SDR family oxidoreductase [Candidatus Zixiibacteriota bacterium]
MKYGIITGASRGIGRAIAVTLATENYKLFLQGRDEKGLSKSCKLVTDEGGKAVPIIADLSSSQGVDTVVNMTNKKPLDLIVNNAGMAVVKPFEEITLEEWQRTLAVNVTAPFLLIKNLLPVLTDNASIVNILSIAARTGFPNWSSYCMSKFALEGFTQSIREELRPRGIRVINIYPSTTNTDIWDNIPGEWHREQMMSPDEVARAVCFAVNRPSSVLVENITIGGLSGTQ